jgi:hypothetical protein
MLVTLALFLAAQEPSAPPPAPSEADKKICRREAVTGSNMSRRICHTKAEWKAITKARESAMESSEGMRNRGYGGSMGGE